MGRSILGMPTHRSPSSKGNCFHLVDTRCNLTWALFEVYQVPMLAQVCSFICLMCRYWPKALTGNMHPGPTLPYGMVSVTNYSGAYPSGYGLNDSSSSGAPSLAFGSRYTSTGFTHFQVGVAVPSNSQTQRTQKLLTPKPKYILLDSNLFDPS